MKSLMKFLSALLIGIMLVNTAFAADFMYGDGDNDGVITSSDAALAIKNALLNNYIKSLDVDGNGYLSSTDAALIIKKVLNNDFTFPVETASEDASETTTSGSSSEDETESSTEQPSETTTDSSSDDTTESSTEQPSETTTDSSSDDITENITESSTESEESTQTEESTDEPAEDTTEDSSYNKTWNIGDFVDDSIFAEGETITEATTVDDLEIIATANKYMTVPKRSRTVGSKAYTHSLNLSGTGKTTERAVAFDVNGSTTIGLVIESGNTSEERTLKIVKADGTELAQAAAPTTAAKQEVTINYTGKIYLYSASSGIHIFEITRTAAGGSGDDNTTTEEPAETTTENTDPDSENSEYSVQGFAAVGLSALDTSGYMVYEANDAKSFLDAVVSANKGSGTIIKVTADLNLGYKEVTEAGLTGYSSGVFKKLAEPLLHPTLMETGVSQITISGDNVVIYSPNANKIKHTNLVISGANNVVIRNLTFAELWEWDEYSLGHYDRNDWDYIGIQGTSENIWIDHCTFQKSYDGIVDSKAGSKGLSITWCKFESDEDFVREQIEYLEQHIDDTGSVTITNGTGEAIDCLGLTADSSQQTSPYANVLYRYLRFGVGLTTDEIVEAVMPQQKTHLVGASELASDNADLEITLAYNLYYNSRDRMPRLRGGNAHIYNCVIDSSTINTVYNNHKSELTNVSKISGITGDGKTSEKFDFSTTSQSFVTTEDGAMAVENCVVNGVTAPVKNNQKKNEDKYTGKFKAENVLVNGTLTTWDGSQDAIDADTGNALYPINSYGAPAKVFSWNETQNYGDKALQFTPVDPTELESKLTGNVGAGVISLDWTKLTY